MRIQFDLINPMRLAAGLAFLALLCSGCSQNGLLAKPDYQKSREDLARGEVDQALLDFPRGKEESDFITTMEKGYLSLIEGKPELKGLQQQDAILEKRVRYHVSREARTFFYVQTPEDYYASEHEVIWLHFLLSWGYSLQGKFVDGCVEAREASTLLSLPWSPAGHFDDATMRLFSAVLWTMCGDWREAQVDLRAAWFLDNSLTWAKALAEHDKPPANLFVVLGGTGPEPMWNPELSRNPLRSERQISFKLRGLKSPLTITDAQGTVIKPYLSPDASKWYARHLARESELHELIADSAYGRKATVSGAWAGTKIAATTGAGLLVGIGGTALGVAIGYYGNDASAVKLGLAIVAASIVKGLEIAREGYEESAATLKEELDPSPYYRFVRFLPEYVWLGWSDKPVAYPLALRTPHAQTTVQRPVVVHNGAVVSMAFIPDTPVPCRSRLGNSADSVETLPDAQGNCPPTVDW